MQHPRYSAAGEYYTPGTSARASPVLPVFAARSDRRQVDEVDGDPLGDLLQGRGHSRGTRGVLWDTQGVLTGYSRGTEGVLKGYSGALKGYSGGN